MGFFVFFALFFVLGKNPRLNIAVFTLPEPTSSFIPFLPQLVLFSEDVFISLPRPLPRYRAAKRRGFPTVIHDIPGFDGAEVSHICSSSLAVFFFLAHANEESALYEPASHR